MAECGPEHLAADLRPLRQQVGEGAGERALAGAAFADDRQPFAGGNIEIDAVECGCAVPVGDRKLPQAAENVAHAALAPSSPSALPRPSLKRWTPSTVTASAAPGMTER